MPTNCMHILIVLLAVFGSGLRDDQVQDEAMMEQSDEGHVMESGEKAMFAEDRPQKGSSDKEGNDDKPSEGAKGDVQMTNGEIFRNGRYKIKNVNSGKYMIVDGKKKDNGANV